jgi:predicted nucleic acid-binding Zn ribbon protein
MPIYNFRSTETGEITEVTLRISQLDQYKTDNPQLEQVHLSAPGLTSGNKSARQLAGSDWNDLLKGIKKNSGKGNTIKT